MESGSSRVHPRTTFNFIFELLAKTWDRTRTALHWFNFDWILICPEINNYVDSGHTACHDNLQTTQTLTIATKQCFKNLVKAKKLGLHVFTFTMNLSA